LAILTQEVAHYDVAVIGAGSTGAVLASRLSEDSATRVALIEAGPDYPDLERLPDELKYGHATAAYVTVHGHLWTYLARATDVQAPAPLPRGKVVGGTSAVNGQLFLRGLRSDFASWAAAGNPLWSFEEVLPSFRRIETDLDFKDQWHGDAGPICVQRYAPAEWRPAQRAFVEACTALGHSLCADANRPDAAGVGPIPFNNVGGVRASTATTYLAQARERPNLTVLADTLARRLAVRGERVIGIETERQGASIMIEAEQYVLCAGAIGSPLLLQRSGIGASATLERAGVRTVLDHPGVGAHLADHQLIDLVWEAASPDATDSPSAPRVQVALRYSSPGSERADDMQITVRRSAPGYPADTVSLVPSLELPVATGQVAITSPDPHVPPDIELRFMSEAHDRQRLSDGVRRCLELADSESFRGMLGRRLAPTADDAASAAALDRWIMRSVRTSHHVCGTCRMGPAGDPSSVVDERGRLHGLGNLRVADASIFPAVIAANTNATAIMVGERIAELMRMEAA
jgi:choline dehydrogenase